MKKEWQNNTAKHLIANMKGWLEQKTYLDNHPTFSKWVEYVVWPENLLSSNYEEEVLPKREPSVLSEWKDNPVTRDQIQVVQSNLPTICTKKEHLFDVVSLLKNEEALGYSFLLDLTAVDFLNSPLSEDIKNNINKRFQMQYLFRTMNATSIGLKIKVILPIDENETVPSMTSVWVGANWPEREVYDLMGLHFEGHPNLSRILMPSNFKGHPLRKDFPLKGIGEDYLIQNLLNKNLSSS